MVLTPKIASATRYAVAGEVISRNDCPTGKEAPAPVTNPPDGSITKAPPVPLGGIVAGVVFIPPPKPAIVVPPAGLNAISPPHIQCPAVRLTLVTVAAMVEVRDTADTAGILEEAVCPTYEAGAVVDDVMSPKSVVVTVVGALFDIGVVTELNALPLTLAVTPDAIDIPVITLKNELLDTTPRSFPDAAVKTSAIPVVPVPTVENIELPTML